MVKKKYAAAPGYRIQVSLLLAEGLAVGTLILGRIGLVGTHQNALQRAEVCFIAMMRALMDSAFDALVCIAVHSLRLLFG